MEKSKRLQALKPYRLFLLLLLLLIPLIAMQFGAEVNWSTADFALMGVMLLITGLFLEFMLRKVKRNAHRWMLISSIVLLFLLIWAELAVGVFGSAFAGS